MRYALISLAILWFLLLLPAVLSQELSCPNQPDAIVNPSDGGEIVQICLAKDRQLALSAEDSPAHTTDR